MSSSTPSKGTPHSTAMVLRKTFAPKPEDALPEERGVCSRNVQSKSIC